MLKEYLSPMNENQLWEKLENTDPEVFSQMCDGLVDFQVPQQLLVDTVDAINNGKKVGLVTTHQSFIEVEAERKFCEELNNLSTKPIEACLVYSMPAVGTKVNKIFEWRNEVYQNCHLNMIGIIRQIDRDNKEHPEYTESITPEMERLSQENMRKLAGFLKNDTGCLLIIPFESTLKSGRINLETGKINGMQHVSPDISLLGRLIDKKDMAIPCGIHGGFCTLNPEKQLFSPAFIKAILTGEIPKDKNIVFKASELIDISTFYSNKDRIEIFEDIATRVAQNVPPIARGYYNQFCQ